jgi:hypothetical protein
MSQQGIKYKKKETNFIADKFEVVLMGKSGYPHKMDKK